MKWMTIGSLSTRLPVDIILLKQYSKPQLLFEPEDHMKTIKSHARHLMLVAALVSGTSQPLMANAQSSEVIEATQKVNIAGRQRMLSQRITMIACFMQTGGYSEQLPQMLATAFDLFDRSQNALRNGDAELGLAAETLNSVLAELNLVDTSFDAFAPLMTEIIETGTINNENLASLDMLGLAYLEVQNKYVNRVATDYSEVLEDLPLIHSISIDVAGRQRMLSQKAAKEFCLIDAGINPEANRENLADTVRIFTNTLNALTEGFPGLVMPPPSPSISAKLQEVKTAWLVPSAILNQIANGAEVTQTDRAIVEAQIENVLTLMDEAVGMYDLDH